MATSYEAWAKFDVDAELERVDEQAQRDEQRRDAHKQQRAKEHVEDAVSSSAEQSAQVLAAHAAVAALKARAKAKKAQKQSPSPGAADAASVPVHAAPERVQAAGGSNQDERQSDESAVERLQRQSELFRQKHELTKQIMERRREGEAILQRRQDDKLVKQRDDADVARALQLFEEALVFAQALEKIAPGLIIAEREQSILRDSDGAHASGSVAHTTASDSALSGDSHDHDHSPHESHSCGGDGAQCTHAHHSEGSHDTANNKKKKKVQAAALPKANDLDAVLKMLFKDIYMGIGACHSQQTRLAAASDAFKDVLLRDDAHVAAWLERGRAFERMSAGLLAMLHFSRAAALDPQNEIAKEAEERVNETLLSGADDVMGADAMERKIEALTQVSLRSMLNCVHLLFQEANVLMLEGFFQYAIPKYQVVLGCIDFVLRNPEVCVKELGDLAADVQESLHQMQEACCLNIAGGHHEMQKSQLRGVEYCEKILKNGNADTGLQSVCHFRIGQLLRSVHSYERALEHLVLSRKLTASLADGSLEPTKAPERQREALKKIDKEIDRCAFERSQHDLVFIRSLLEQKSAAAAGVSAAQ